MKRLKIQGKEGLNDRTRQEKQEFLRSRAQEERYLFQCYEKGKGKCIQMLLNSV